MSQDNVNRPSHYTDGKIEVIDFIEDKKLGFHLGNTLKYIARAGKKDPAKTIEDLEKARWYLDREIANRKSCVTSPAASSALGYTASTATPNTDPYILYPFVLQLFGIAVVYGRLGNEGELEIGRQIYEGIAFSTGWFDALIAENANADYTGIDIEYKVRRTDGSIDDSLSGKFVGCKLHGYKLDTELRRLQGVFKFQHQQEVK